MSFEPSRYLNQTILAVPKSGIRKFFDVAATMPGAISLGVGEPDFVTPYHIRNAAINSLLDGETAYTSNWGLLSLREEIARYMQDRYHLTYDQVLEDVQRYFADGLRRRLHADDPALDGN